MRGLDSRWIDLPKRWRRLRICDPAADPVASTTELVLEPWKQVYW